MKIHTHANNFLLKTIFHLSPQLKTNQGRFVLSSEGDLQIVQLHRTDAGTYVCVAYNGIGNSVEREVKLTVDGELFYLHSPLFEHFFAFSLWWMDSHFMLNRALFVVLVFFIFQFSINK